jgi:hypothetical protein
LRASLFPFALKNAAFVWEYSSPSKRNTSFKAKADINRNIALSLKNDIKEYGGYIFGVSISDFGRGNRLSYGIQVNLDL